MPETQAHRLPIVGLAAKPVGKPDARNPHVRFDATVGTQVSTVFTEAGNSLN